jgi:hypothetical protein
VRTLTHSTDRPVARVGSWYDEETGRALAQEAIDHSSSELRIAFVSTPAAYRDFLKILSEEQDEAKRAVMGDNVYIFEFDRRFGEKYGDRFCFYDYNAPTSLPDKFHHFFDYVLMEPPHLVRCSATMAERVRSTHCRVLLVSFYRAPTAWKSSPTRCGGWPGTWKRCPARRTAL